MKTKLSKATTFIMKREHSTKSHQSVFVCYIWGHHSDPENHYYYIISNIEWRALHIAVKCFIPLAKYSYRLMAQQAANMHGRE